MNKKVVRRLIMKRLKGSETHPSLLYHQLFSLKAWQSANVVSVTLSTPIEISTWPIIKQAWRESKQVVVPKVRPNHQMIFVPVNSDTKLVRDQFGILEPVNNHQIMISQMDLMIVPGLAFTRAGDRLGFGGGYYDRIMKAFNGVTIALARPEQIFDRPVWPVNRWDVKVNAVITNKGVSIE